MNQEKRPAVSYTHLDVYKRQVTDEAITNYGSLTLTEDERALCNVAGISENFVDKMEILDGEKNIESIKEKLRSGDYILAAVSKNTKGGYSSEALEKLPDVGEIVTIYKNGKPLKKVEVLSQILVIDSEQISGSSVTGAGTILGPWFYLGEDLFKELYGDCLLYTS